MILRVTLRPASLISLTMSACGMLTMDWLFTASILSPTFSFPQRSAGLPSMMRPILWGTAVGGFKHNTLQVKTCSAADWRITPVCAHTPLTDWMTEYASVSLILLFTPGLCKASRVFFHVCGRCADAHGGLPKMCVTDVPWEGMYNWGDRMRGASLFIEPWPLLILKFGTYLDTLYWVHPVVCMCLRAFTQGLALAMKSRGWLMMHKHLLDSMKHH